MWFKLANLIMGGARFLADNEINTGDIQSGAKNVADTVSGIVNAILTPVLGIISAAGIIWAIVLGVNMARADSTEKREEAKKRLIALIVGIVIMVVLILFFNFGLKPLLAAFKVGQSTAQ